NSLHGTMDARAFGRLAQSARRIAADTRGVPRRARVCDGWLRCQHNVLRQRHRPEPRICALRRLYFSRVYRTENGRAGQSDAVRLWQNLADRRRAALAVLAAALCPEGLAIVGV